MTVVGPLMTRRFSYLGVVLLRTDGDQTSVVRSVVTFETAEAKM